MKRSTKKSPPDRNRRSRRFRAAHRIPQLPECADRPGTRQRRRHDLGRRHRAAYRRKNFPQPAAGADPRADHAHRVRVYGRRQDLSERCVRAVWQPERSSAAIACRSSMRRTTRRRTDSSAIRTVRSVGLPGRSAAVRSVSDIRKTPRESACRRICRRKASPSGSRQPVPAAPASRREEGIGDVYKLGPRTVRECATERRPYRARAASETLQLNA